MNNQVRAAVAAEGQAKGIKVVTLYVPQTLGDAPGQLVAREEQPIQVGEVAQLERYLPAQLVTAEEQVYQVGQAAQFRRYLPAQLIAVERQASQADKVAQLERYLPAQLVV